MKRYAIVVNGYGVVFRVENDLKKATEKLETLRAASPENNYQLFELVTPYKN